MHPKLLQQCVAEFIGTALHGPDVSGKELLGRILAGVVYGRFLIKPVAERT